MKEKFKDIFTNNIKRHGADNLLDYLENKTDFFISPASAKYHLAVEGGLCMHSLNVYESLVKHLGEFFGGAK